MSELDRILERARQNRTAREGAASSASGADPSSALMSGGTLLAGARVFDRATGLEGDVLRVEQQRILTPEAGARGGGAATTAFRLPTSETIDVVTVRLSDRRVVLRTRDELVLRPTPPGRTP